jgi:geranylgeranyl diphosphate synthase type I
MFIQLKNELDRKLEKFITDIEKRYSLKAISPLLFEAIKDFVLRPGKRIRPILFIMGYRGFSQKDPKGLFESALAIEVLHDFLLVHDDIIDKSDMRRGKPSMHTFLNDHLKKYPKAKFNGQDLAIIVGDVMFAIAIDSFLTIDENPARKEKALRKFVGAACYTGCGEFIDTISGAKPIGSIKQDEVYAIYDYKTAYYTFACPLVTGAILAGADETEIKKLFDFGIYLGRAFQIKDDILGIFAKEEETGKPSTSDLKENKKTLLLWFAYQKASKHEKNKLEKILSQKKITQKDITTVQEIMVSTKSLANAKEKISSLLGKAITAIKGSKIKKGYKDILTVYSSTLLKT